MLVEERRNNKGYGHDYILKSCADMKVPCVIPGEVQHGWHADSGLYIDFDNWGEQEKAARYFVWNRRNLDRCEVYGYHNVTAIGAPFLYLPPATLSDTESLGTRSLLLFPIHTWEGEPFADPVAVYRAYLDEIAEVLDLFHPVTACLYWTQYQEKQIVQLFIDRGIYVVTLGHRDNNPLFLTNFQNFTKKYSYVSSNIFSSAVFYSLYMRRKVFICGEPHTSDIVRIPRLYPKVKVLDPINYSELYSALLWKNFDHRSLYWIGETELGLEFKRSPSDLKRLFGWDGG